MNKSDPPSPDTSSCATHPVPALRHGCAEGVCVSADEEEERAVEQVERPGLSCAKGPGELRLRALTLDAAGCCSVFVCSAPTQTLKLRAAAPLPPPPPHSRPSHHMQATETGCWAGCS